jgi:hypothetical protein
MFTTNAFGSPFSAITRAAVANLRTAIKGDDPQGSRNMSNHAMHPPHTPARAAQGVPRFQWSIGHSFLAIRTAAFDPLRK